MAIWDTALELTARFWTLGRKVEDLLELQRKTHDALDLADARLRKIEDRLTHLEASQGNLVVEARGAASAAASGVASAIISDAITRLTRLEMRAELTLPPGTQTRLPPSP